MVGKTAGHGLVLEGQGIYSCNLQTPESELGRRKEREEEVLAWVLRAAGESGETSGSATLGKLSQVGRQGSRVEGLSLRRVSVSGLHLCVP